MVELYQKKGLSKEDAETVVGIMSQEQNIEFFVDVMMTEELNLVPVDEDDSPFKDGLVTFGSFVFFGFLPIIPYMVTANKTVIGVEGSFIAALILTAAMFILLGVLQAMVSRMPLWRGGALMLFNGVLSSGFAYGVGALLNKYISV
jgi:VIT1/CCC1 family predicted Fe2+/Mn2+ transporter